MFFTKHQLYKLWSLLFVALPIFWISTSLLLGCSSSQKSQPSLKRKQSDENITINKTISTKRLGNKDSTFFSIKKTPCYGECPVYKIVIYQDGSGQFNGQENVEKKGLYKSENLQKERTAILNYAQQIGFFQLAGEYPQNNEAPSDFSHTITYLSTLRKSHKIINKGKGAPQKLREFETFADSLLKSANWQPVK